LLYLIFYSVGEIPESVQHEECLAAHLAFIVPALFRFPLALSQHSEVITDVYFQYLQYYTIPPKPLQYQGFGGLFILCCTAEFYNI
jgi:1,4-dihydroxy-2-naphthoate octaprenyltransferase